MNCADLRWASPKRSLPQQLELVLDGVHPEWSLPREAALTIMPQRADASEGPNAQLFGGSLQSVLPGTPAFGALELALSASGDWVARRT